MYDYAAGNDGRGIPPLVVSKESERHQVKNAHSKIGEEENFGDEFRGKTSTSSQRTLRYNDFELVQK